MRKGCGPAGRIIKPRGRKTSCYLHLLRIVFSTGFSLKEKIPFKVTFVGLFSFLWQLRSLNRGILFTLDAFNAALKHSFRGLCYLMQHALVWGTPRWPRFQKWLWDPSWRCLEGGLIFRKCWIGPWRCCSYLLCILLCIGQYIIADLSIAILFGMLYQSLDLGFLEWFAWVWLGICALVVEIVQRNWTG